MQDLKLIALDAEDLEVLSAHSQDAVLTVGDMTFLPREKRFVALLNRFDHAARLNTKATTGGGDGGVRRRAALRVERVSRAEVSGIALQAKASPLALLAVQFEPDAASPPHGRIVLVFAGNAALRLHVDCIEAALEDLGPAWRATRAPNHDTPV